MGGSSVPSNTTQTTLLDPIRQKGLQDASKYFNKWAATYNGPTYKGPLVAGRTQDWYTAQDMAHKMANRFSEGGITSVRRFDSGGTTVDLSNPNTSTSITLGGPNLPTSAPETTPVASTGLVTLGVDNTPQTISSTNQNQTPSNYYLTPEQAAATGDWLHLGVNNAPANLYLGASGNTGSTNTGLTNTGLTNTGLTSLKDTLSGGAVKDSISGGLTKDTLSGGAGVDTLPGGAVKDTIATPVYTKPTYTATPTTTNTQSPYLMAQALAQKGIGGIYGITDKNLTPQQIANTYTNPDQITPGTITPDMWNATAMDTYMSPYTKGVVDIALREADRQRAIERLRENTAATQSGAFGGYRQGVVEAEGERNYNQRLGDIVNTGYQNAYNNAQTQFNADRASSVGAQTTNQANALQAYQNNQAALQQAAILDAQAGQNNITNARQSVLDQLNALNMGISGASQLPAIETAYQQGSGTVQNALNTADASARSAMQAYYDAISKLSDANGNINLQKAQNLSNIMFGNNIPSGVQATVKT